MPPTEAYECGNCYHVGPLNQHGRCEVCDSRAVISAHLVEILVAPRTGIERHFAEVNP